MTPDQQALVAGMLGGEDLPESEVAELLASAGISDAEIRRSAEKIVRQGIARAIKATRNAPPSAWEGFESGEPPPTGSPWALPVKP